MKIFIDQKLCTGCGLCANLCPTTFDMNEENRAIVRAIVVTKGTTDEFLGCQQVCIECPEKAISIR